MAEKWFSNHKMPPDSMLIGKAKIKEAKVRYAASASSCPDTILTSYRKATATDMTVRKLVNKPNAPKSAGPYSRVSKGAAARVNACPRADPVAKIPTLRMNPLPRRRMNQDEETPVPAVMVGPIVGEVSIERISER